MEDIKRWLKSDTPDYTEGVALFKKYSRSYALIHYFLRKENLGKLKYELEKLDRVGAKPIAVRSGLKKVVPPTMPGVKTGANGDNGEGEKYRVRLDKGGKIRPEDLPTVLREYYDRNADEHKLMRSLHEKLKLADSGEKRAEISKELVALDNAIAGRWDALDKWAQTGKLPQVEEPK
ncbi:MAG: hypothetical protein LBH34_03985, partial [Prevotellaceae bacterium]|nr:hypothetical protein [Prevotellaceae bacterium]